MATLLMKRMNHYTTSNNNETKQHTDNIVYTQQIEKELQKFRKQNKELKQQLINSQTDNKLKDLLLTKKSNENMSLQHEIEYLKKQLKLLSNKNNYNNKNNKKFGKRNKNNNIMYTEESKFSKQSSIASNTTSVVPEEQSQNNQKIYEGYMLKKGKFNTEFQRRYFILYSNNTLSYYDDANDELSSGQVNLYTIINKDILLGQINLYTIINIKQERNTNTFHLITPKRTFTLKCEINNEFDRWIEIIKLRVFPKIICKNWFYKRGERNKSWKLRYCTLCELIDFKKHYEIRYYEDEKCNKYKGYINCNDITIKDITFLPNATKLQQYGKDLLLELTTQQRIYIFAAKDINSKRLWYESLSKISDMPRISHSRNASNSMTIPSIPPTPKTHIVKLDYSKVNKNIQNVRRISNSINNNMLYAQNQLQLLTPISESGHNNDNNDNNDNVIMQQSDINDNIQCDEWGDVNCELS
eukprot:391776_1